MDAFGVKPERTVKNCSVLRCPGCWPGGWCVPGTYENRPPPRKQEPRLLARAAAAQGFSALGGTTKSLLRKETAGRTVWPPRAGV